MEDHACIARTYFWLPCKIGLLSCTVPEHVGASEKKLQTLVYQAQKGRFTLEGLLCRIWSLYVERYVAETNWERWCPALWTGRMG